jgi:hypothetical protein
MKFQSIYCISAFIAVIQALVAEKPLETLTETSKTELLVKAEQWGVPQPKDGAKLLKIWVFQSGDSDYYALGFVEEENPKRALVGFDYWDTVNRVEVKEVPDPEKVSLADVSPRSPFSEVNGVNFGLVTGIQLLRAGNSKVGTELINKSLKKEAGHPHSAFRSPAGETPVVMLARSCLADAMNQISSEKPDFPKIKQRIEKILKDQPQLKSDATDWSLEGLDATINYQPAQPGTIEALIDDYLLSGGTEGAMNIRSEEFGKAEKALIFKGFEAVPALIKLRESRRLTNHVMQGFNNFPSYSMNVGQVVNAYLQRLANNELGSNWLDRQKGATSEDDALLAWWKNASEQGEKTYVSENTIVIDKESRVKISRELLAIAQTRYPELLPLFYEEILKTDESSWLIADTLVASAAPVELKLKLLNQGIATNQQEHRNAALSQLQSLNKEQADEHLIRLLKAAPKTAKEAYWTDQDAMLGGLVSESTNEEVWNMLHKLLDRADLGMQMELIDHLKPPKTAPDSIIKSFHKIYDRFRDDARIRDESTSKKFSGPGAGFPHDKLSMRDFVHMHWARWYELKQESPKEGATQQQWKAYRTAVRVAIDQARLK